MQKVVRFGLAMYIMDILVQSKLEENKRILPAKLANHGDSFEVVDARVVQSALIYRDWIVLAHDQ